MKDQTNLIISIVAIVFMIGWSLAFFLGQRKEVVLPAPTVVNVAPAQVAEGAVVFADKLPNAGSGSAAGGGAGGGGSETASLPGGGSTGPRQVGPGSGSRAMGASGR